MTSFSRNISIVVVLVAFAAIGCGGDGSSGESGSAGATGGTGAGARGGSGAVGQGGSGQGGSGAVGQGGSAVGGSAGTIDYGDSYSVSIGPISVSPGHEDTECVIKRLDNPATIRVGRISNTISSSSHHLIVYRTNDTEERSAPFGCTPFLDTLNPSKGAPLVVTQKYDDVIALPPGVAYTLDAGQMIRLELHYINAGASSVDVAATATFDTISDADFEHEADFLFMGNVDIDIPPNSSATIGPAFFAPPAEFVGSNFFGITGHTHQYGKDVYIEVANDENAPGTPVYDVPGWTWDEPATIQHAPPFQLASGAGFRFTCEYQNTSSQRVGFGESANQEMCFFWAYYYPSKGARVCFYTETYIPGGVGACCPGNPLCGAFF